MTNSSQISKVRLINWYDCGDSGVININGNTMLSGGTGVGKSSLVDAIYSTLFVDHNHFNRAANPNSKRSLMGYVRCEINGIDENGNRVVYKRNNKVMTYVVFEMTTPEHKTNILGTCYTSDNPRSDIKESHFFISNCKIEDINLLDENNAPLTFTNFKNNCDNKYEKNFRFVDGVAEGERLFSNAMGFYNNIDDFYEARKKILKIMAFNPSEITRIETFFRKFFLRESPMNMENMNKALLEYDNIKNMCESEMAQQKELKQICELMKEIDKVQAQIQCNKIIKTIADYTNYKTRIAVLGAKISADNETLAYLNDKENGKEGDKYRLETQQRDFQNCDEIKKLATLRKDKEDSELALRQSKELYERVANAISLLNGNISKINSIFETEYTPYDIKDISYSRNGLIEFRRYIDAIGDDLTEKKANIKYNITALDTEIKACEKKLNEIKNNNPTPNESIKNTIEDIKAYFKSHDIQDEPKMLFQLIDIKDGFEEWQKPLEYLLSKAKFDIIVDKQNYSAISRLLKEKSRKGIGLVDTTAFENDAHCDENSVCNFFEYNSIYAEKYIKYKYGRIRAIDTCIDIVPDKTGSYLGKDGTSYSMKAFSVNRDNMDFYIGKKALQIQAKKYSEKKADLENKKNYQQDNYNYINSIVEIVYECNKSFMQLKQNDLKNIDELPVAIENLQKSIVKLESDPDMFTAAEQLNRIAADIKKCTNDIKDIREQIEALQHSIGGNERDLENNINAFKTVEEDYNRYRNENIDDFNSANASYNRKSEDDKRKTETTIAKEYYSLNEMLSSEKSKKERDLERYQMNYSKQYNQTLSQNGMASKDEYRNEFHKVDCKDLPSTLAKLKSAQHDQNELIKKSVIQKLQTDFNNTKRMINETNKKLANIHYGNKKYKIRDKGAAPGIEEIYHLLTSRSVNTSNQITLEDNDFTNEEYDKVSRCVCENEKYQDYRNFMNIDVEITETYGDKEHSRWLSQIIGTSSGGETEIAFHILSAIAITNIYNHCDNLDMIKINILDEAFRNMDDESIKSMMQLYNTFNLQTIVAAPDNKNDILQKTTDNAIIVLRNRTGQSYNNVEKNFIEFSVTTDNE